MRILLDGAPMLGRVTGIGQYGLSLLKGLVALSSERSPSSGAGLEAIGVFDGREVLTPDAFVSRLSHQAAVGRNQRLKSMIRRIWPSCRDWADRVRRFHLSRQTRGACWDVFHEPNFVSPQYALPLVTTVHDMSYLRYPQFLPKDRLAWLRRKMGQTLARSRVILTDSHFTRRELLDLCPAVEPQRVVVTQLGVDFDYYSDPAHDERVDDVRRRLRLPERFVLFLGTLEPRKNLQGLIAAYGLLPSGLQKSYPLVLAGMPGWNQAYFRREMGELRRRGVLHEVGYVAQEDVPALMRAASVFCFPSFYEGFGLPPLEAAACGTPVVSSLAASLPEVLGEAAVYVNPNSPQDIAAGLERTLDSDSLRERLKVAGKVRAALFRWDDCATRTVQAYRIAA
ncbi:MAG TPA: glycosyltransferase family 1 protein [Pirellulales bacterium]|nr:glycosyltransferase family 1 protein [Pirellulales bacterium]